MIAPAILAYWLATRRSCYKRTAVSALVASIILTALPAARAAEPTPPGKTAQAQRLKGEFILSRKYNNQSPICQRFTQNLNQFRGLDFKTCNPRLSKGFPEFSRPNWEEIPFDLELAEQLFKSAYHSSQAATSERHWQQWLGASSAAIRQGGHIRMWRARIDLDGNGSEETIIRVMPIWALLGTMETEPHWSCDYIYSSLHITDSGHTKVIGKFDGRYGDIIYSQTSRRYYQAVWVAHGPLSPDVYVAEAAGVILANLNWDGLSVTDNVECVIDWISAGQKRRH